MAPRPAVRRAITNENDENAASTRVTRAKAANLNDPTSDLLRKPVTRTKSTLSNQAARASKRTALNDLSNQQKESHHLSSKDGKDVKDGKDSKAGFRKPLVRPSSLTNAARPTKVEKSTRNASKPNVGPLQEKTLGAKRAAATTAGPGHVIKSRKVTTHESTKQMILPDPEAGKNQDPINLPPVALIPILPLIPTVTEINEDVVEVDVDADADVDAKPHGRAPLLVRESAVEVWPEMPDGVCDLDKEDIDDPLMVAEYVVEIFEYLKQLEQQTMPNPRYMDSQPELQWDMRGILVDWLIEVHTRFRLLPETLFLTVNILDRFCSNEIVQLDRLQLVGVAAMFIASKYEEVLSPHISNFRHVSDDGFTEEEILHAERCVLTALNYDLSYPNPMNFLRRISKADDYDVQTRTLGKYLVEISCLDHRFIEHPPSVIAAAAMYVARLILGKGPWHSTIAHYAGCTEEELLPVFYLMLDYLSGPVKHEAFFKKYAHKKFMKVSVVIRNWVKEHGPEYLDNKPEFEVEPILAAAAVRSTTTTTTTTSRKAAR